MDKPHHALYATSPVAIEFVTSERIEAASPGFEFSNIWPRVSGRYQLLFHPRLYNSKLSVPSKPPSADGPSMNCWISMMPEAMMGDPVRPPTQVIYKEVNTPSVDRTSMIPVYLTHLLYG